MFIDFSRDIFHSGHNQMLKMVLSALSLPLLFTAFFLFGEKKNVSGSLWTLESDLSLKAGSAPLVSLGTYLNVSEAWFPSKLGAPGLPSISGEGKGCNSAPCGVDRSPAWLQLTAAVPDALAWDGF